MQFYDKLIGLPLFQGLSSNDLQVIVSTVKFNFMTYPRYKVVVERGMPCKQLIILVSGELEVTREHHGWKVTEVLTAPAILQPEHLFGMRQNYTHSFVCKEKSQFISISKQDAVNLSGLFLVFRLNLLNIISTTAQKALECPWQDSMKTCRERIMDFLYSHTIIPGGPKVFHIRMQQLADELQLSRLLVSNELNKLDSEGIIILQRGIIKIR